VDIKTIGHLSQSSINMFLRCPAQFMFRYIQGLKVPPSANLSLGKAVDGSLNFNYKWKMGNNTDKPLDEVLDFYSTEFDGLKEETEFQKDEDPAEIKDSGVRVIEEYQNSTAPTIQPIACQKEVGFQLSSVPIPTVGYIDLIDDRNTVIDNKVKSKSPTRDKNTGYYLPSENEKLQMTIYENGLLKEGFVPSSLRIDSMITTKVPKVVPSFVWTTANDLKYVENLVQMIKRAVEAEIFIPNRHGVMCTRRHCGFWHFCEKQYGGSVRE